MRVYQCYPDIDKEYLRMSEVAPFIRGGRHIWYHSTREVTTTVVVNTRTFAVFYVEYHCQRSWGRGWHYFIKDGRGVKKVTASQLSSYRRWQVWEAYRQRLPYACRPFKPRKGRKPVDRSHRIGYKVVLKDERLGRPRYKSLYDSTVVYCFGKTRVQRVMPNHGGGYYVYDTPGKAMAAALYIPGENIWVVQAILGVGGSSADIALLEHRRWSLAVLECEVWGRSVVYGTKHYKTAWSHIRPLREVAVATLSTGGWQVV